MPDHNEFNRTYPPLTTVGKNRFPFTLACPSFVYPAGYVENVRRLAPFVDEIQLLFFESRASSLPSAALVDQLAELAAAEGISYNIHLPSDVYLAHPDPGERRRAADVLGLLLARCAILAPSSCTLHLNRHPQDGPDMPVTDWQARMIDSLQTILPAAIPNRRLSVETLDYPFDAVAPVITALDLSVCMDMGHLLVQGMDIGAFFGRWRDRVAVIHLHGVDGTKDHLPLDRLAGDRMTMVLKILSAFDGVVCLEVYSHPGLDASLAHLKAAWFRIRDEEG